MLNEIPQVFHRSIYSKLPIHIYIYIYINILYQRSKHRYIKIPSLLIVRFHNFSIDIEKIHFYLSGRSNSSSEPSQGVHLQNENARPPGVSCPQLCRKIALHCSWLRNEKKNSKNGGRSSLFP